MTNHFFTVSLLVLLPFTSLAQPCEFKGNMASCERDKVKVLRQPGHYIHRAETSVYASSKDNNLTVQISLNVDSEKWNFNNINEAYGHVDGTNYMFEAERTKTKLRSFRNIERSPHLERVIISVHGDAYIQNIANASSFRISVGGAVFNFEPVINDFRSVIKNLK